MASPITSVLAFFCVISIAYGLTCYNCESDGGNRKCSWNTEECDETILSQECFTITVPILTGQKYTKRGCLPQDSCDTVKNGVKTLLGQLAQNVHVECETCRGNKCNSATSLTGFTIVGLILSAVAFIF